MNNFWAANFFGRDGDIETTLSYTYKVIRNDNDVKKISDLFLLIAND